MKSLTIACLLITGSPCFAQESVPVEIFMPESNDIKASLEKKPLTPFYYVKKIAYITALLGITTEIGDIIAINNRRNINIPNSLYRIAVPAILGAASYVVDMQLIDNHILPELDLKNPNAYNVIFLTACGIHLGLKCIYEHVLVD